MNQDAYESVKADAPAPLLFLCDHASNAVPKELDRLGLPEDEFARHIAYDIGAAALTRTLAEAFAAPAIIRPITPQSRAGSARQERWESFPLSYPCTASPLFGADTCGPGISAFCGIATDVSPER